MTKLLPDQAEGLRRLFVADVRRMIAVMPAQGDGRDFSAKLAHTLARQGKKVLLLDEALSAGQQHQPFDVTVRCDLATVLMRNMEVEKAIIHATKGVDLIAGGGQVRTLPRPRMEARIGLVNAFYRLAGKYDVVLVDVGTDAILSRPSFAWACQDVILLCGDKPDSVTQVYGYIKSLHQAGERRFHLLFKGEDGDLVQTLYRNVATVSRRHLHVMPDMLGMLPGGNEQPANFFEHLADSVQAWPLPEHKAGYFPALMRRLLTGVNARTVQSMIK